LHIGAVAEEVEYHLAGRNTVQNNAGAILQLEVLALFDVEDEGIGQTAGDDQILAIVQIDLAVNCDHVLSTVSGDRCCAVDLLADRLRRSECRERIGCHGCGQLNRSERRHRRRTD